MEEKISETILCPEYQTMDESLEYIFSSMIRQDDVLNALDFIRSIDIHFLPSKSVMCTVIFDILMKNENIKCLAFASDYLMTVLNAFPPTNENRKFYYDSIRGSHGFLDDLWTVFCYIVQSYFYHREIYIIDKDDNSSDPIKYPNCKFLLEFYVKLFTVDFEHLQSNSFNSCLMMKLLWPSSDICLSSRSEQILKWINDIYGNPFVNNMGDLLGSMHELLSLMVKCFMQGKHNLSDHAIYYNPSLAEIVEAIINFCKNAFKKHSNVKLFLTLLSFKYLQAKVSEKIIRQIIKQSSKRGYVFTLRDIVDQYMFPKKLNKWKSFKPIVNKEKNLRKRSVDEKIVPEKKIKTKLHELCRKSKFGDLFQALQSSCEDVNTRDRTGCTPLHEACQVGSFMCVKIILEQASKASCALDVMAPNFEGFTPLHTAIKKNDTSIAGELLRFGGSELLIVTDNKGHYPSDYSKSEEMDKLLHEYQLELNSSEFDAAAENRVPISDLKSFKDYSIYLHALNCLLCSYCNIFHLYDFIWKKNTVVQSHSNKICCHYIDDDVCSDDADLILEMPDLIEKFIETVRKNASKHELNIDIELIPLKAFAASLKVS